jgi:di/tricarboxylate transporter
VLLYTTRETAEAMRDAGDLVVTEVAGVNAHPSAPERPFLATQGPLAVGIVVGVVLLAALDLLPVVVAALAGMVAMLLTGVLRPSEAYDAVAWEVVFLLAGVLPLGLALARSGGADYLGGLVAAASAGLPPLLVMALFYVLTGLFANVVTPVASVVLFLPVAVDAAAGLGADPFAFVLAVTFAGSTAFMTPMGYQTNLMVYSPGGYRFTDFVRVGGPLQLLLAAVTPVTIDLLVGVT